jgi:hypothetical protein
VIAALAVLVLIGSLTFHEYWRDECQAALLAEHTPITELLGALRYEGHPPLLHVLLKISSALLPRPYALSVVGALGFATLLIGIYRWLRTFTPASARLATLCTGVLAATYTVGYELGIVARGYGYGIGLALLGAAFAKSVVPTDPIRRFIPIVLCLGGAILSSVHTACLASSIALAFVLAGLREPGARVATLRALTSKLALPLAPFAIVLLIVVVEPVDRDFPWVPSSFHVPAELLDVLWRLAVHAFAPQGWWSIDFAAGTVIAIAMVAGIGYLVFVNARTADALGWFLPAAMINSVGMIVLCVFRYFGEYRHHTILVVPWVLCLLGVGLASGRRKRTLLVAIPLGLWFVHQVWLGVGSVHRDAVQAFSQTREVAAVLPADAHLIASHDALATCVGYHRPDVELRALQGRGRVFTYVLWDRERTDRIRIEDVVAASCADGRRSTYLLLTAGDERLAARFGVGPSLIEAIDPRKGRALPDEEFALYEVPCDSN